MSSCSPPASGRATSWPAAAVSPIGERGGVRRGRAVAAPTTRRSSRSASARCVDGRVYGLVAPGLRDGRGRRGPAARRRRRQLHRRRHVDEAEAAGRRRRQFRRRARPLRRRARGDVHRPRSAGSYEKLVVTDDATTLLGGVLVGDAIAVRLLRPLVGRAAAGRSRRDAARPSRRRDQRPARCPTTPKSARATTSTRARSAARSSDDGCTDVAGIKACTKAGTGCGSCVPLLQDPAAPSSGVAVESSAVRALRRTPAPSCSTWCACDGITTLHRAHRRRTAAAVAATSASRRSPRSWPASDTATSSTASRPRCRTPTTTSWPTSSATAPTRWCRASPAARSPRTS